MIPSWNLAELIEHVRRQPGDHRFALECISSVSRFDNIFRYHFYTARDALKGTIDKHDPTGIKNFELLFGTSEQQEDHNYAMLVSDANIIACIHTVRSIFDIVSQLVNVLALGSIIPIEKCDIYKVRNRLPQSDLKTYIDNLLQSYWFGYIAGFINTSKHRKLINHGFHLSFADNIVGAQVGPFEYNGKTYPACLVHDLLPMILEVKNQVVGCGQAINAHCIPKNA